MSKSFTCWKCGSMLKALLLPMSRREQCAQCHADQHVCKMCQHYQPKHRIFCQEERADPPSEIETANFCDYFEPAPVSAKNPLDAKTAAAKAELEALFGGDPKVVGEIGNEADNLRPEESKKAKALEELNKLFAEKPNDKS